MAQETGLPLINNAFYDELGERWYADDQHIIALLRAETRLKLAYIREIFGRQQVQTYAQVLDIGCGAGFLANSLAADNFTVTGIDLSAPSVAVAERHAPSGRKIAYQVGSAYQLPYADHSFDAVLLMDVLEHVEKPALAIAEASRVLKPGGSAVMYTFNRTWLAKLLAIEAVEFIGRDCPPHFHVWHLFIKPKELASMCVEANLLPRDWRGVRPKVLNLPFWQSLLSRRVHKNFDFAFTQNLQLGYLCHAIKPT